MRENTPWLEEESLTLSGLGRADPFVGTTSLPGVIRYPINGISLS
jgi:hypothetical protein